MLDRAVTLNDRESFGGSVLPLPLNLIVHIIAYVCLNPERIVHLARSYAEIYHSSTNPQILRESAEHVAFSIT